MLQESEQWIMQMINYIEQQHVDEDTLEQLQKWIHKNASDYLVNRLLFRFILPKAMKDILIHETHNGIFGGHFGYEKTLQKISSYYYWPSMNQDVQRFCNMCLSCARFKDHTRKTKCKSLCQFLLIQWKLCNSIKWDHFQHRNRVINIF